MTVESVSLSGTNTKVIHGSITSLCILRGSHRAPNERGLLLLFLLENQQLNILDKGNYTQLPSLMPVLCRNGKLRLDSNHRISIWHRWCLMVSGRVTVKGKR